MIKEDLATRMAPVCGKGSSVLMGDAVLVESQKNLAVRGTRAGIVVSVVPTVFVNFVAVLRIHAVREIPALRITTFAARTDGVNYVVIVVNLAARGIYVIGAAYVAQITFAKIVAQLMNLAAKVIVVIGIGLSAVRTICVTVVEVLVMYAVRAIYAWNGRSAAQIIHVTNAEVVMSRAARGMFVISTMDAA